MSESQGGINAALCTLLPVPANFSLTEFTNWSFYWKYSRRYTIHETKRVYFGWP